MKNAWLALCKPLFPQSPLGSTVNSLFQTLLYEPLFLLACDAFWVDSFCPHLGHGVIRVYSAEDSNISSCLRALLRRIHLETDAE